MTHSHPVIIQDEETRKSVDPQLTIGDLCQDFIERVIVQKQRGSEEITVLYKGGLYYFDVICKGFKPPYEMQEPEEGSNEAYWFGQKAH